MTVLYQSTRAPASTALVDFATVVTAGLAPDGGLYCPITLPEIKLPSTGAKYTNILEEVLAAFLGSSVERSSLQAMSKEAFAQFRDDAICPLRVLEDHVHILDLTKGPTLAFKDFALQMLAQMLDNELASQNRKATVIGATSGDTGSAAIEALRQTQNIKTVMLHPQGRVSEVQRRQMTTVQSDSVLNIAIEGSFDDCQDLVKACFADVSLREKAGLTAVNSINWARVLVQISYYFSAYASLGYGDGTQVSFAVPTGNFGNVLAGWYAKQLGLPIERFVVACNRNDAFAQFLASGELHAKQVYQSHSPSMDIAVPSNLERLLWEASGRDGDAIAKTLRTYRSKGSVVIPESWMIPIRECFVAVTVSDDETVAEIQRVHNECGVLIDPHSAVGTKAAHVTKGSLTSEIVVLETAAPAKFPDVMEHAVDIRPPLPSHLADLLERKESYETMPNDQAVLASRILEFIDS